MSLDNYSDYATYGIDPWSGITLNEREWYDPVLREFYNRAAVYSPFTTFQVDLNGPNARTIYFNDLIPPRPNIATIANRAMEATRLFTDSFQRQVTTERYGNGMAFHRESNMFNYWQRNGDIYGILNIINNGMGQVIIDHLDTLARNEFFRHPYSTLGIGTATGFDQINESEKATTEIIDTVRLSLRDRQRPFTALPVHYIDGPTGNEVICVTTAGVVHDLMREITATSDITFIDAAKYADPGKLIQGELGMWRGVRFVENGFAKLWNMGLDGNEVQTTITVALAPGDGAADPETTAVEGVRYVGQPGATHQVTVADSTGFAAGDMVTIHRTRHADIAAVDLYYGAGSVDGPIFDDPFLQNVEVNNVPDGSHLVLKEPYMMSGAGGEGLETDLGSTVYGYVTKAVTLHSMLFLVPGMSNNGLVAGVAQPPNLYTPQPIDDYMSVYRVAYDMWLKYQLWEPRAYDLRFVRGANALMGRDLWW